MKTQFRIKNQTIHLSYHEIFNHLEAYVSEGDSVVCWISPGETPVSTALSQFYNWYTNNY